MTRPVRVLIAEDQPRIRDALAELIGAEGTLELVGVAGDAEGAISLAESRRPDVVLADVKMPGGDGVRIARELGKRSPGTRVVALSAHQDRSTVLEMLRAGAVGYVVKGAPFEEILDGVHRAARGEGALSSSIAGSVIEELHRRLDSEGRDSEQRRARRGRILRVIREGSITTVLQPIFDLADGRVVGAEALARFPSEPPRSPDLWFAEAADLGLAADLELASLEAALGQLPRLLPDAYLGVNVSPDVLVSPHAVEVFKGAPVSRLVVEVTEHAPVEDYERLHRALRGPRGRGMRLAVDDAGAGFASLRHILQLDPDLIKLDVTLTSGIHGDDKRQALAAALISFASRIGATVVAEGIETEEELTALRALGVPCGQGYHLSRPAPAEELARFLEPAQSFEEPDVAPRGEAR